MNTIIKEIIYFLYLVISRIILWTLVTILTLSILIAPLISWIWIIQVISSAIYILAFLSAMLLFWDWLIKDFNIKK